MLFFFFFFVTVYYVTVTVYFLMFISDQTLSASLGWTSRTQFEETWATLLGVLVTQPIVMDQEESQQEVKLCS